MDKVICRARFKVGVQRFFFITENLIYEGIGPVAITQLCHVMKIGRDKEDRQLIHMIGWPRFSRPIYIVLQSRITTTGMQKLLLNTKFDRRLATCQIFSRHL